MRDETVTTRRTDEAETRDVPTREATEAASRAFAGVAIDQIERAEAAEAEANALRGIVRELLRFVPYEKPEQGPLPDWIVDVADRARTAAGER